MKSASLVTSIDLQKVRRVRLRAISLLAFSLLLISGMTQAHPHNWIDLKTRFVLDEKGFLVQVVQRWEFDAYYSMMTHADLLNEFGDEKAGFKETARRMINSLKDYEYFSKLSVDGAKVSLGIPDKYRLSSSKKDGETVLALEMTFDVKPKLKVESRSLAWQVYDPTYYIAMNHLVLENIEVIGGGAIECSKRLTIPEPSEELLFYAQSLDKTQRDTDGLGANFAETVTIECI